MSLLLLAGFNDGRRAPVFLLLLLLLAGFNDGRRAPVFLLLLLLLAGFNDGRRAPVFLLLLLAGFNDGRRASVFLLLLLLAGFNDGRRAQVQSHFSLLLCFRHVFGKSKCIRRTHWRIEVVIRPGGARRLRKPSLSVFYKRFHRAHAPGPKVTSGLCLYILVAPATNTVKVMSNEVVLRLLCCGMCFTYIHLFICGDPPQYQNFSKRLC